eukprot:gene9631-biopygen15264
MDARREARICAPDSAGGGRQLTSSGPWPAVARCLARGPAVSGAPPSAVGALPWEHCRGSTAVGALPGEHCRGSTAVGALPWEHCRGALPWEHCRGALPGEHCRGALPGEHFYICMSNSCGGYAPGVRRACGTQSNACGGSGAGARGSPLPRTAEAVPHQHLRVPRPLPRAQDPSKPGQHLFGKIGIRSFPKMCWAMPSPPHEHRPGSTGETRARGPAAAQAPAPPRLQPRPGSSPAQAPAPPRLQPRPGSSPAQAAAPPRQQ